MAHHQKMGAEHVAPVSVTSPGLPSTMPAISEDESVPDPDEPPDFKKHASFLNSRPKPSGRRQSLLTAALHEEPEQMHPEPEDNTLSSVEFARQASRSSTASSIGYGFTSDDGHTSAGTRASTPSSPPHNLLFKKPKISFGKCPGRLSTVPPPEDAQKLASPTSESSEPQVEGLLGRKRCISFACGGKKQDVAPTKAAPPTMPEVQEEPQPAKKPCSLRFVCPSKVFGKGPESNQANRPTRYLSPAPPPPTKQSPSPARSRARHRDSDTATLKAESPKSSRKSSMQLNVPRLSNDSDIVNCETAPFHEFASSEEEPEAWTTMSSCYKSRLTVSDTLSKENRIRQLGEEVEEEALEEDVDNDDDDDDSESGYESPTGFSDEDAGFRTDDEEGFAESSDDEADGHEMYSWWEPRKTRELSPFVTPGMLHARRRRATSPSSINSRDSSARGRSPFSKARRSSRAIPVQTETSELPDSTDFVCGTLDEDRPLEEAFKASVEQRRLAAHVARPQDVDPSFPTSDPEIDTDESDDEDVTSFPEPQNGFVHGQMDNIHELGNRGRKPTISGKGSPRPSPRRLRSPPPTKRTQRLFDASPLRRSSPPKQKLTSPPSSPRISPQVGEKRPGLTINTGVFLGQRPQLTHTASLPRSPHPFFRKRPISPPPPANTVSHTNSTRDNSIHEQSDDDDGAETVNEDSVNDPSLKYKRSAIDIVQGLERKRLRRRQKFYEKYCRKEKKREERRSRPLPGKGAERMRQIGVECAVYRGKRVLSV